MLENLSLQIRNTLIILFQEAAAPLHDDPVQKTPMIQKSIRGYVKIIKVSEVPLQLHCQLQFKRCSIKAIS